MLGFQIKEIIHIFSNLSEIGRNTILFLGFRSKVKGDSISQLFSNFVRCRALELHTDFYGTPVVVFVYFA